ncbi:uncharacterized protein LOC144927721 isoform X5 [Branchiostoma floridae x Branchiostoma belcheri]
MPADLAAATVISEPVSAQKEGAGQSWTQPRTCIGPLPPTSSTAGCPSKCAHFTAAYTQRNQRSQKNSQSREEDKGCFDETMSHQPSWQASPAHAS